MAANTSNIWAGEQIGATPDGRKQGEPLSDAASPTYGRDTHCPTMTVNSLVKLDYTKVACASVVNQKFLSAMFRDGKRDRLQALSVGRIFISTGGSWRRPARGPRPSTPAVWQSRREQRSA